MCSLLLCPVNHTEICDKAEFWDGTAMGYSGVAKNGNYHFLNLRGQISFNFHVNV